MLAFFWLVFLSLVAYLTAGLRHVYAHTPAKELKRIADKGDKSAKTLYRVTRHGLLADYFLLAVVLISGAIAIVIAGNLFYSFFALIFVAALIFFTLIHRPSHPSIINVKIAENISPELDSLLIKLRPYANEAAKFIKRRPAHRQHTGIYEKADLLDLLDRQKKTAPSRINGRELDMAMHALTLEDKQVKDVMVPRRTIHFVHAEEPVGPVLMSELHDSGFSRFPVRGDDENKIVGTLYLREVVEREMAERAKPGIVSNIMDSKVFYVGENEKLDHVLDAFIKTRHHLFMAVNEFEEIVGLITIEDVLEQLVGRKIVDEFDQYDDLRAVARTQAREDNLLRHDPE